MGWSEEVASKWLELLQETVPHMSTVAVLANPDNPLTAELVHGLKVIAPARELEILPIEVRGPSELDQAFAMAGRDAQGLIVLPDPIMAAHRVRLVALAARHNLPAMYYLRDFVEAGGLIAYGPELSVMSRRAGDYIDKILRGANPSDLPIEQPREYLLVVNLSAAKDLGVIVPESVLVRAGEVMR